jgi:allophanate hydrolase
MIDDCQTLLISDLLSGYRANRYTPRELLDRVLDRIEAAPDRNAWITRLTRAQVMTYVEALEGRSPDELPLYGVPFAIKDNIDLAGVPTTAACPDYAYTPERTASIVARLVGAGAIPVGKTNLDQFATGLVGARSPYGPGRNPFDPDYVSGGSSSGSAIAVSEGLVSFALGTDTAGSGRVPAAFCNLVGLKPTRGLLSSSGVVPACRSLDTVSIFALDCADAARVLEVAAGEDADDPYSRGWQTPVLGARGLPMAGLCLGVPRAEQLEFFGDADSEGLFSAAVERARAQGAQVVDLDLAPFLEAARLLYEGPWVAERTVAIGPFLKSSPEALHPVTRGIIAAGEGMSAVEAFRGQYRLQALRREAERAWDAVDAVLTPTAGTIYRIDAVEAEPLRLNANLGYYTNFMNLLDLAAVAVPAGFRGDGLPFGVTLFAPAFTDRDLLVWGDRLHRALDAPLGHSAAAHPAEGLTPGAVGDEIPVVVCGAHMQGLALNHQLTERGARLLERGRTAADYRFYALPGGPPARPGLVRVPANGSAIEVEVWAVPGAAFGSFVAGIPAPLGIGKVVMEDGRALPGFICEGLGISGAEEITALGGWRAYLAR